MLKELDPLLNLSDEIYEKINVKRAHNTLAELHKPLLGNIEYAKKVLFETILRNKDFCFEFEDIVSEAQLKHIRDLSQIVPKGYLFHILLEEEINKVDFEKIKERLPGEAIAKQDKIERSVLEISKGIERAYQTNMSMINLALILYSYIKMSRI